MTTQWIFAIILLVIAFIIWKKIFPTKKYVEERFDKIAYNQYKQTKILTDMRNVFFSKNRKSHKKGGK